MLFNRFLGEINIFVLLSNAVLLKNCITFGDNVPRTLVLRLVLLNLITKEFLQQNYVYYLVNRKGGKNIKKKKGKLNYVIEKLKQYSILKGKIIEKEEIKSFGLLNEEEYDDVIERLNTEGIILKVSKNKYEICV